MKTKPAVYALLLIVALIAAVWGFANGAPLYQPLTLVLGAGLLLFALLHSRKKRRTDGRERLGKD